MSKRATSKGVRAPSAVMVALRDAALRAERSAYRKPKIGAASPGRRLSRAEREAVAAKLRADGKL